ncbi:hypothetical protein ACIRVK_18845 [Streptomyces sp. NPDC101152]|uniref:hypothetical protein n=1 Tax=Streptomyces sp. NPDC101152 TaxID=3366116 RepID=UPI00382DB85B
MAPALTVAALLAAVLSRCQGDGPPPKPWIDGTTHGRWRSVFHGMGRNVGDDASLSLSPMAAEDPGTTHAGLVVSTASYADVRYEARTLTVRQLRSPRPNPWEVPWLVWAYRDPEHSATSPSSRTAGSWGSGIPRIRAGSGSWRRAGHPTPWVTGTTCGSSSAVRCCRCRSGRSRR